jgi:hypothetical protein
MWKVAIAHLAVTAFVYLAFLYLSGLHNLKTDFFLERKAVDQTLLHFCWNALILLQPLTFGIGLMLERLGQNFVPFTHPNWLVVSTIFGFLLIPSLLWSFCFGWFFVKLDNWLNHFPVLGKRIL